MKLEEALSVLGLSEGASEADAKRAYRKLALKWHPDKNGGDPAATKRFQQISTAYRRVTDPESFEDDDDELTEEDMMEMFAMMFGEMFGGAFPGMSDGMGTEMGMMAAMAAAMAGGVPGDDGAGTVFATAHLRRRCERQ